VTAALGPAALPRLVEADELVLRALSATQQVVA
jgi:hypothetical protein